MRLEFQVHSFRIILLKDFVHRTGVTPFIFFKFHQLFSFVWYTQLVFFVVSFFFCKNLKPIPIQPTSHPPILNFQLQTAHHPKHQLARWQVTKLDVSLNTLELIPSTISNLVDCEIFLAYSNQLKEAAFVFFLLELRKAFESREM